MTGLWIAVSAPAFCMTPEEAYRAIPHQRTVFDAKAGAMSEDEKRFLEVFFELVDSAIVLKVEAMQTRPALMGADYQSLKARLESLETPPKLSHVKKLVHEAIKAQEAYLAQSPRPAFASNDKVGQASQKLREAYGEIMSLYPNEKPRNKQAFFDYLCALDFL